MCPPATNCLNIGTEAASRRPVARISRLALLESGLRGGKTALPHWGAANKALAVVGALVAAFVNAAARFGFLIVTSTAFFQVPVAFGALIILSIMGVVLFQIVVIAERVFFPWSSSNVTPAS